MSDEEREAMSYLNDVIHRVRSKDEGEEDPLVLLFRSMLSTLFRKDHDVGGTDRALHTRTGSRK